MEQNSKDLSLGKDPCWLRDIAEGGPVVETEANSIANPTTCPLQGDLERSPGSLTWFALVSKSSRTHHLPWGPGGGTPGGTAPGWGAPAGCCCCGPAVDTVCPICSEGPKLPGGTPLLAGAGATEAGAIAKPWTVGGPAAPVGGTGWEPGGRAGGGCCCCWCICWKCCCRALISAYFSCSMWKACLSARSCCL